VRLTRFPKVRPGKTAGNAVATPPGDFRPDGFVRCSAVAAGRTKPELQETPYLRGFVSGAPRSTKMGNTPEISAFAGALLDVLYGWSNNYEARSHLIEGTEGASNSSRTCQ
jgi:hypothetical protein